MRHCLKDCEYFIAKTSTDGKMCIRDREYIATETTLNVAEYLYLYPSKAPEHSTYYDQLYTRT